MRSTTARPRRWPRRAAIFVLTHLLPIWGCSDASGPSEPAVGAVVVEPASMDLEIGETRQLVATVLDSTGGVMFGRPVTWSTDRPAVASVSVGGLVTAVAAGDVRITATAGGATTEVGVHVHAGPCDPRDAVSLPLPALVTDSVSINDCILLESPFADPWLLTLDDTMRVELRMSSADFDPLILVTDLDMDFVAYDDGRTGAAAVVSRPLAPGSYVVWATTVRIGPTGAYTLEASASEIAPCATGTIEVPDTVSGTLSAAACIASFGYPADPWSMSLDQPTRVQIDLRSEDFDAFVWVTDIAGTVLTVGDDWGGTLDARVTLGLPAGEFTIWASSFGGAGSGDYILSTTAVSPTASAQDGSAGAIRRSAPAKVPWEWEPRSPAASPGTR